MLSSLLLVMVTGPEMIDASAIGSAERHGLVATDARALAMARMPNAYESWLEKSSAGIETELAGV